MIPRGAAIFGIIGIVPFLAGASLARWPIVNPTLTALAKDDWLLLHYGTVILCFLSGVLWGFATRTEGREAGFAYTFAVLPAIFAATALLPLHPYRVEAMILGYTATLLIDFWFWNEGIAPMWWMRFRAILTVVVLASLTSAL
ncbi:DUF3429 domain-containing protein [Gemmobacter serpentinus]|uniref:DUF3429 domain-containing protein n=1 Tax=Gemmobacter serpentinus TaxID=2652247 RepID=UPI00124CA018|nr:DUF3429 domain-containing protein [Gemmobacter serpentinus]